MGTDRKNHSRIKWGTLGVALFVLALSIMFNARTPKDVDASQLLDTIAKGESRGNYNAYYGNAGNTNPVFTEMNVAEVLEWQQDFVAQGSPSSAVGRYQFVMPTFKELIEQLEIDQTAKFDVELQDYLAKRLLERRGLYEYMRGRITKEQFAYNLSKEWAALPKTIGDNPDQSYYAGDGLNHVQVSIEEVTESIDSLFEIK